MTLTLSIRSVVCVLLFWPHLVAEALAVREGGPPWRSTYPKIPIPTVIGGVLNNDKDNNNNNPRDPTQLFLQTEPLIGGPSWLPLHVRVVLEVGGDADNETASSSSSSSSRSSSKMMIHAWDFVPLQATEAATLQRLSTLQGTPGALRYYQYNPATGAFQKAWQGRDGEDAGSFDTNLRDDDNHTNQRLVQKAQSFCEAYSNRELHLVTNNCWTFAIQLVKHISTNG